jgi:hypothetical protein
MCDFWIGAKGRRVRGSGSGWGADVESMAGIFEAEFGGLKE